MAQLPAGSPFPTLQGALLAAPVSMGGCGCMAASVATSFFRGLLGGLIRDTRMIDPIKMWPRKNTDAQVSMEARHSSSCSPQMVYNVRESTTEDHVRKPLASSA